MYYIIITHTQSYKFHAQSLMAALWPLGFELSSELSVSEEFWGNEISREVCWVESGTLICCEDNEDG